MKQLNVTYLKERVGFILDVGIFTVCKGCNQQSLTRHQIYQSLNDDLIYIDFCVNCQKIRFIYDDGERCDNCGQSNSWWYSYYDDYGGTVQLARCPKCGWFIMGEFIRGACHQV